MIEFIATSAITRSGVKVYTEKCKKKESPLNILVDHWGLVVYT